MEDSDDLFSEDVFNLLRGDPLLQRMRSYNFSQLINSPDPPPQQIQQQQEQQQQQEEPQQQLQQREPPHHQLQQPQEPHHQLQQQQEPQQHQELQQQQQLQYRFNQVTYSQPHEVGVPSPHDIGVLRPHEGGIPRPHEGGVPSPHDIGVPRLHEGGVPGPHPQQLHQHSNHHPQQLVHHYQLLHNQQDTQQRLQEQQLQPPSNQWDVLEAETDTPLLLPEANVVLHVERLPSIESVQPPSLQPWPGRHNFMISVVTDNKDKNKWCYSPILHKLYVCPYNAVPVNVSMLQWVDASVRITPVFKQSQYLMEPVARCYNCTKNRNYDANMVQHIVHVEGERCCYEVVNERNVVTVPLSPPPPGERTSTLLLKLTCLTSCVGGPNRRPFCLVLTLHSNVMGEEIGRQILDIKCCKCPQRDMTHEEKSAPRNENNVNTAPVLDEEKSTRIRKLAAQIKVGQKRRKHSNNLEVTCITKTEPGIESGFVNVGVPVEFEKAVKKYVNALMAAQLVKQDEPGLLLYPEAELDLEDNADV